jgi:arsenate reductase
MNTELEKYCSTLESEFDQISDERKKSLEQLSEYISSKIKNGDSCNLTFICTHNSRRSHFGQIWAQTAAYWYNIENIKTYSGGTESTAFNKRSVAALSRAGFEIENKGKGKEKNPKYFVTQGENFHINSMFSKKYDHPVNPDKNFAAVMVCSDADENCPFVPGAEKRFSITYEDPKAFDDTDKEKEMYDERCRQIAREMFYVFKNVRN